MNTPRTDAVLNKHLRAALYSGQGLYEIELSDLSRTLERELSAKSAECQAQAATIARLREALEHYATCCDGCTCGDGWGHETAITALQETKTVTTSAHYGPMTYAAMSLQKALELALVAMTTTRAVDASPFMQDAISAARAALRGDV